MNLKQSIILAFLTSLLTTIGTFAVVIYQFDSEKRSWFFQQEYLSKKNVHAQMNDLKDEIIQYYFEMPKINSEIYSLNFQNIANTINPIYTEESKYIEQIRISKELKSAMDRYSSLNTKLMQLLIKSKSMFSKSVSESIDLFFSCKLNSGQGEGKILIVDFLEKFKAGNINKDNFLEEYANYNLKSANVASKASCPKQFSNVIQKMSTELSPNK